MYFYMYFRYCSYSLYLSSYYIHNHNTSVETRNKRRNAHTSSHTCVLEKVWGVHTCGGVSKGVWGVQKGSRVSQMECGVCGVSECGLGGRKRSGVSKMGLGSKRTLVSQKNLKNYKKTYLGLETSRLEPCCSWAYVGQHWLLWVSLTCVGLHWHVCK